MKIIDKYIFKQVLFATIIGIVLFIIIWISPETLFRIMRQVSYGEVTRFEGVQLLFLAIPEILGKAIPVGLMLGSLFVFNALGGNSELTIFRGIGVSFQRLVLPVVAFSLIGTALCFVTYDKLIPYSSQKIREIRNITDVDNFVYVDKDQKTNLNKLSLFPNTMEAV